jgi:CubicO group peptidase (beta-lactamase class C family)
MAWKAQEQEERALAARVGAALDAALEERRVVGAVVRVARDGVLVAERVVGLADREAGVPMREHTVFRYSSLTKPIVAATAMGLLDRGVLELDAPVARWLPEFQPTFDGKPARITVRHLLTHTSGLTYGLLQPKTGPYRAARVSDGMDQPGLSIEENLRRLAPLPLAFAPGSAFLYSLAYDVLGAVIERATGESLAEAVARAVTRPLGMERTGFVARQASELATPYADGKPQPWRMQDGAEVPFGDGEITFAPSRALDARSYASGGAGMVGTADDFLRFIEAIRTGRGLAGGRWLEEMLLDQIAPIASPILRDGWGYGFGVAVLRDPGAAQSPLPAGSVRWGGVYGHSWWIDRATGMSAVLLTNTAIEGMSGQLHNDLERALWCTERGATVFQTKQSPG